MQFIVLQELALNRNKKKLLKAVSSARPVGEGSYSSLTELSRSCLKWIVYTFQHSHTVGEGS